jgi:ubiquitin-protein ligase/Mg-chelatase subunit ChlD
MSWRPKNAKVSAKANARQRLMKEALDLQANPVQGCSAQPLEQNIFEWHANITTPQFEGAYFHFVITFTEKYPKVAPTVVPQHHIEHPNVFGDYICLDILTMSEETETTPYRGWTSAYTVSSLLVQLQCFLFDVAKNQRGSRSLFNRQYQEASKFTCAACGHCSPAPFPPLNSIERRTGFFKTTRLAAIRAGASLDSEKVCELPENTMVKVTEFEGHRACIDLTSHSEAQGKEVGYCSIFTKRGVLLESCPWGDSGVGLYKCRKKTSAFDLSKKSQFELAKKTRVKVIDILPLGDIVVGKIEHGGEEVFVDLWDLNFKKSFDVVVSSKKACDITSESYWLNEFYGPILDILFELLDSQTCTNLSILHPDLRTRVENSMILLARNYRCFFTLKNLDDPDAVLGFGIKCEVMNKRSRHLKDRRGYDYSRPVLQRLAPSFDLMTYEAFYQHGCITNVWKDCVFDAFLPLYINKKHGSVALDLAEKCILQMWKQENKKNSLTCERLLETLAKLMNTTIVNMNKCIEDLDVQEIQLFDSIKAIEGYMAIHHLLLAFSVRYPKLIEIANKKIYDFCKDEAVRDKENTPDVGELIVYLAVSKYSWKAFFPAFAKEVFDRNARWILAKYPGLREIENDDVRSCIRLTQSFLATRTGKRLAAFQSFFMNEIACPTELQKNPDKVKILFSEYNNRLGKPAPGLAERLQVHSRKVLAMKSWHDYFELVGFAAPTSLEISKWLRQSIIRSSLKNYHNNRMILKYSENHIESPSDTLHMDRYNCMCAGGKVFSLKGASSADTCTEISKPKSRLDVCFVVDCTGSMGTWLSQAKKSIKKIIKDISAKTQYKVIRFALVAYRDHGRGKGTNGYVVKEFEFTTDVNEMQKNVNFMEAGGGADAPEAMSCGLAKAAALSWNKNASRFLIHIGDEKPHGVCTDGGDDYPDGCPCGNDALSVAHHLAKQGIPIYNIFCGYGDGLTKTFYHAISHITNGQCISMQNASSLSDIVLGAAVEEQTMEQISQKIAPVWNQIHDRHPNAREDQIIRQLWVHLTKKENFKVKCVLGGEKLDKYAMKSIETIAFCTDLKQVKAMQTKAGEHFSMYSSAQSKLETKAGSKLITESQVRKWYKRNQEVMAVLRFREQGCMYAQPRFLEAGKKEREKNAALAKFKKTKAYPWESVNKQKIRQVFSKAGNIAKNSNKGTALSLPKNSYKAVEAPQKNAWDSSSRSPSLGRNSSKTRSPTKTTPQAPPPRRMPNPALEQVRQPMARNISYPTNPASRSDSTNSNPFPGRGPMIQSIRRSSSTQRGAPIQSIRTSRSNSRERSIPEPVSSSRSESGSSLNSDDRTVVVKFDNNDLISHFLSSRFFQAGVNHPCKVKVHNGFAEVVFPSASDAKLASGSRLGFACQIQTLEQFKQTHV